MSHKRLTEEECTRLLKEYGTPDHVVRHCRAVADAAVKLAKELNLHGAKLDIELIKGAALIHDIMRVEENHWDKGADIARNLGYEDEADIIKVHMTYDMKKEVEELREVDLVCFGDRVVKEDKYVGLEDRMKYVMDKLQNNPAAVERITKKTAETKALLNKIEKTIGKSIDEIMEKER